MPICSTREPQAFGKQKKGRARLAMPEAFAMVGVLFRFAICKLLFCTINAKSKDYGGQGGGGQ